MITIENLEKREKELLDRVQQVNQQRNGLIGSAQQIQQKINDADANLMQINGQIMEVRNLKQLCNTKNTEGK